MKIRLCQMVAEEIHNLNSFVPYGDELKVGKDGKCSIEIKAPAKIVGYYIYDEEKTLLEYEYLDFSAEDGKSYVISFNYPPHI